MKKSNRERRANQRKKSVRKSKARHFEFPPLEAYADEFPTTPSEPLPTTNPELSDPLATPQQVMTLLNISRRTLQRLIASDQIPGRVKVGNQNRFVIREIEAWISQQSLSRR